MKGECHHEHTRPHQYFYPHMVECIACGRILHKDEANKKPGRSAWLKWPFAKKGTQKKGGTICDSEQS